MELLSLLILLLLSPIVLSLLVAIVRPRPSCYAPPRGRPWYRRLVANQVGGVAMETLTGFVTAPGAGQVALTMSTGDSLAIKNTDIAKAVRLLSAWTLQQTAGTLRIRSPKMHDNVQGIRAKSVPAQPLPLWGLGWWQRLYSNDVLTVDLSGSAVAGDIETAALLLYYDDLPGQSARFIDVATLMQRGVNLFSTENTISTGATGGWSGSEAINAESDLFKANTDYALLGYVTDTNAAAVAWKGADTGNLRVGGPGHKDRKELTGEWFKRLSEAYDRSMIPVFNSNNKGGINIDTAVDENGADPLVHSFFVELAPGTVR